jgi:hypothetical protein
MPSVSVPQSFGSVFHDPRYSAGISAFGAEGLVARDDGTTDGDVVVGEAADDTGGTDACVLGPAPADSVGTDVVVAVAAETEAETESEAEDESAVEGGAAARPEHPATVSRAAPTTVNVRRLMSCERTSPSPRPDGSYPRPGSDR